MRLRWLEVFFVTLFGIPAAAFAQGEVSPDQPPGSQPWQQMAPAYVPYQQPTYAGAPCPTPPPCPDSAPQRRELAGHLFVPSDLVLDPFTDSLATRYIGAGVGRISGPPVHIDGLTLPRQKYTQRAIVTSSTFQWGLADWFALRFDSSIQIFTGSNDTGVLVTGQTAQYAVGGGTTLSFRLGHRARIGATVDALYTPISTLDPLGTVSRSIAAGRIDATGLTHTTHEATIVAGVTGAFALNPALGLVGNIQYLHGYAETAAIRADTDGLSFGILGDLDFQHILGLPLAVNLAYRLIVPMGSGASGVEQDLDPGGFLTIGARKHLVIGGEMSLRWFRPTAIRGGFAFVPQVLLRYYW